MSDLEKNIMEEKRFFFSLKDVKWVVSTAVFLVGWLITIILWVQDKNKQKIRIEVLETKNYTLEKEVEGLKGEVKGINRAADNFMTFPPNEAKFRIELLEKRVDKVEEKNGVQSKTIIPENNPIRRDR